MSPARLQCTHKIIAILTYLRIHRPSLLMNPHCTPKLGQFDLLYGQNRPLKKCMRIGTFEFRSIKIFQSYDHKPTATFLVVHGVYVGLLYWRCNALIIFIHHVWTVAQRTKKYCKTAKNHIGTRRPTKSHRQWDCSTIAISSAVFVANNIYGPSKLSDLTILAWLETL